MMQQSDLSPTEVELIRKHRAEQQGRRAALDFQQSAISTAHQFMEWSARTGQGLTFSTFVNQFEYQHPGANDMYRAVERILNAALPQ